MTKKIAVMLADGFEEIEAVVPIDVLRRLEFDVILAGEKKIVQGSHGIKVEADCLFSDLKESEIDAIFLPGGMPGSVNLRDNPRVIELIKKINARGGVVSAICAAPIALKAAGIIEGKTVTSHPSVISELGKIRYTGSLAEKDGNIITGKGPGASFEFVVKLAAMLGKGKQAEELMNAMFVQRK